MAERRLASRALEVFMVAAILALAIWVDIPRADASIPSTRSAGSLTVTAKWVGNAWTSNDPGQEVTMSGDAPDSAVCSPTQTCHEPKLAFATAGTVCPATWSGSQQSVVPAGSNYVSEGPFSKTFKLSSSQYPQLKDPSKYKLCGYLVDASTNPPSTVATAETALTGQTVAAGSMTLAAHAYNTIDRMGEISIDVAGSAPEKGLLLVDLIDSSAKCAATEDPNETPDGLSYKWVPVSAGPFSTQFDLYPRDPDSPDMAKPLPGSYAVCAYLVLDSAVTDRYQTATPSATASVHDVVVTVPACPSTDFSVDDVEVVAPFWAFGPSEFDPGFNGAAWMHVDMPGSGTVYVDLTKSGVTRGDAGSREITDGAGTYGIDVEVDPRSEEFLALYRSQSSKTFHYTVTYRPTVEGEWCELQGEVIPTGAISGSQSTSIDWVPAKTIANECENRRNDCPSTVATGCYVVQITCYERTLTLNLTKKKMSGTLAETGGGTHCYGTGKRPGGVFLWKLVKGEWDLVTTANVRHGKYSASLAYFSDVKKGTFQAVISMYDPSEPYACGNATSNVVKL